MLNFDKAYSFQRNPFIYYYGAEGPWLELLIESVKNSIVTYTLSYTQNLGTRK